MVAVTEPLHVIYLAVQLVSAIWNVKIAVEPGYMTLVSQTFGSKFLLTYSLLKKVNEFVIRSSMQMEAT
jgi:hypothetical protein